MAEYLCPTCGSPCVTSNHEWVCLPTATIPALTDLDRRRRLRRMRTTLKRPGVWVTGPLTRRKLYPPTRRTH